MATNTPGELSVSKGVMGALVGGIVLCLVVIAFLLGRQSAPRQEVATVAAPAEEPHGATAADSLVDPLSNVHDEPGTPDIAWSPDPLPPAASGETVVETDGAEPLVSKADRAAVARYFALLDEIAVPLRGGADPESAAREILGQVSGGNSGALDELVAAQESALEAVRGMDVPDACRTHHSRLVAASVRAGALLQQMRSAMTGLDLSALQAVAVDGEALQTELREIEALGRDLRRRYGA